MTATIHKRVEALEASTERSAQNIIVIDEIDGPFMLMIQGAESSQEFMRQVAAVRHEAGSGLRAVIPAAKEIKADRLSAGRSE